jgi:hypothetical protein
MIKDKSNLYKYKINLNLIYQGLLKIVLSLKILIYHHRQIYHVEILAVVNYY